MTTEKLEELAGRMERRAIRFEMAIGESLPPDSRLSIAVEDFRAAARLARALAKVGNACEPGWRLEIAGSSVTLCNHTCSSHETPMEAIEAAEVQL